MKQALPGARICALAHLILISVLCSGDRCYPSFSIGAERPSRLPNVTQSLRSAEPVSSATRYLSCSLVESAHTAAPAPQFLSESAAPSGNRALPGTPASEPGVLTLFAQLGPLFHHLAPPRDSLQGLYDAYTWVYRYLRQSLAWWFRAWLLDQFWLCCMVLGKLSSFSGSQLPPLLSGDDNLWWGGPGI